MAKVYEYRRLVARVSDLRSYWQSTGNECVHRQLSELTERALALRFEILRSGCDVEGMIEA